jgi:hypothetical protein
MSKHRKLFFLALKTRSSYISMEFFLVNQVFSAKGLAAKNQRRHVMPSSHSALQIQVPKMRLLFIFCRPAFIISWS